jgi:uncharacterized protein YgiM (DUF1202 family)
MTTRVVALSVAVLLLAGCAGTRPPVSESRPASESMPSIAKEMKAEPEVPLGSFLLDGRVQGPQEEPAGGITIYVFGTDVETPIGFTRSDPDGFFRLMLENAKPELGLLVLCNSNRHPGHDTRYLPYVDKLTVPEDVHWQQRLYYLDAGSIAPEQGRVTVRGEEVNLRIAPSLTSAILGQAAKGESLRVIGRDGEWFWVETPDGARGWISQTVVSPLRK